ncbi:hypothetical protein BG004_004119 [Podila humilis]|nr:hypothetical protein BG004_004119 [Podila humilis]
MAVPPQLPYQLHNAAHPSSAHPMYPDSHTKPNINLPPNPSTLPPSSIGGSKKQKTTPPCDRCRQRRIRCDRLEPSCSSCIKYKAICLRTAFPAGVPLSTVSVESVGGLRVQTTGKRDRHFSETEVLDSCLRDVQSLQSSRLRRIEQFFDRLGIDEKRLDEVSWIAEQIKAQHGLDPASTEFPYPPEEIIDKLGPRASVPWIKQILPLLQASKKVQQVPSTVQAYDKAIPAFELGINAAVPLQAILTEAGEFICPAPKPAMFPTRVPLSVLNKTMFELSVYDHTEYLGPVAGTRASTWGEEMRFPLPWLVPEPQIQESLLVLPPMDQMLELIEWMILSPLYTYFPILTKACILNALSSALPGPSHGQTNVTEFETGALPQRITGRVSAVFLLNAIFALGAAYRSNAIEKNIKHRLLPDQASREAKSYDFQLFFDRARALTVYILDQPRVSSLQGLLLLMKCPAIPGIQNLYREQTCAMALALGLHRDPEAWTLCQSVIQLRCNIFWCCYIIDASYSLNSGSPERFPDDYITIGLPKLPSIENGDDIGEIEMETETNRVSFLIEQAKLWKIVKKIRRCGQSSNKGQEGYSDASNIYASQGPNSFAANQDPDTPNSPSGPTSPPPWVWRADSSRRILDVELAQWQMELPNKLRFDFGLTKQDAPCPFLVRVNGLGAMLQLIFNEVLVLLHHPFLIFADSQSQMNKDPSQLSSLRPSPKGRSSVSSLKSPRSRRSSSTAKTSYASSSVGSGPIENGSIKTSRSIPPFLNSCTKAAEAITFLIDHLLRTTPEWLVCHNSVDSALHIAERVHALNVTLASNTTPGVAPIPTSYINLQQAKNQYKRTRAFRKILGDLDQFTMSSGYRPELVTQEYRIKGSAGERLMRCMRQLLTHKKSPEYYRLPRSPPLLNNHGLEFEGDEPEKHGGQDHLDMKLVHVDKRIWIRYYNVRIKDGQETRNGAESWLEILNPFAPPEVEFDFESDSESEQRDYFGHNHAKDQPMPIFEDSSIDIKTYNDAPYLQHDYQVKDILELGEPMDPPQSSSSALMDLFRNPDPSGFGQYSAIPTRVESPFDSNQRHEHGYQHSHFQNQSFDHQNGVPADQGYNGSTYFTNYGVQDVPLENYDGIEPPLSLDSPNPERVHSSNMGQSFRVFQQNQPAHGYQPSDQPSHRDQGQDEKQIPFSHIHPHHQHQQQQQQQQCPPQLPLQSQGRDQHGAFDGFDLPPVLGFESTLSSPPYSSPGSPTLVSSESAVGLGLMSNTAPLSIQSQLAYDSPYLGLIQQHFPNHTPQASSTQMLGISEQSPSSTSTSSHALSLSQQLDSSFAVSAHQAARPFYGMPMGGFMSPALASLPEISRSSRANSNTLLQSTPIPEVTNAFSSTSSTSGSSSSSAISPQISTALSSPTSPLISPTYRMVLSPTTEALQGISNTLNSWNGLSHTTNPHDGVSRGHDQRQLQQQQQSTAFQSLMDYPSSVNGASPLGGHRESTSASSTSQYASSWASSGSPTADSNSNTPASSNHADLSVPSLSASPSSRSSSDIGAVRPIAGFSTEGSRAELMDVVETQVSMQRTSGVSAVPDHSNAGHGQDWD